MILQAKRRTRCAGNNDGQRGCRTGTLRGRLQRKRRARRERRARIGCGSQTDGPRQQARSPRSRSRDREQGRSGCQRRRGRSESVRVRRGKRGAEGERWMRTGAGAGGWGRDAGGSRNPGRAEGGCWEGIPRTRCRAGQGGRAQRGTARSRASSWGPSRGGVPWGSGPERTIGRRPLACGSAYRRSCDPRAPRNRRSSPAPATGQTESTPGVRPALQASGRSGFENQRST